MRPEERALRVLGQSSAQDTSNVVKQVRYLDQERPLHKSLRAIPTCTPDLSETAESDGQHRARFSDHLASRLTLADKILFNDDGPAREQYRIGLSLTR